MKYLIIIIIIIMIVVIPFSLFSQKEGSALVRINKRLDILEHNSIDTSKIRKEISGLNSKYDIQIKNNELTLSSISKQIEASVFNLTIFGYLFSIAVIVLGIYVTYIQRKIVKIKSDNEILLSKTLKVKDEVVEINRQIQNDIYGLYKKIKREETANILQRLMEIPKDISNVGQQLLSRVLLPEDYGLLKKAYIKLKTQDGHYFASMYAGIMFQHFLGDLVRDEDIGSEIIEY